MKAHFCPAEKTTISYEGECNWCGEKEMKQEPVAWMYKMEDGSAIVSVRMMFNKDAVSEIPLYTAPRELSDEELFKLSEENLGIKTTMDLTSGRLQMFARAILKKASEK